MFDWDNIAQTLSGGRTQTFEVYSSQMWRILSQGTIDTIYMVSWASFFAIILGLILGIILYITKPGGIFPLKKTNWILGIIINIGRSIPFVILIMVLFPLARIIIGTSIGRTAAVVPLTIAAIPFMSRVVEGALNELGHGIIEAAVSAGANIWQIIFRVILPEAAPGLVSGFTLLVINLVTFSAMAGIVGGGGLGHVANSYGYQRHRTDILVYTLILLVIIVQVIQAVGQYISKRLDKR